MTTQTNVKNITVSETTRRKIQLYARLKRVEKALEDKIEKAKQSILLDLGSVLCVALFNDAKLASVSEQSKTTIDAKKLLADFPLVYNQVTKESEPFLVLRTH